MKTSKVPIALLSLALTCGLAAVAHAQEGYPARYGDHDDRRGPDGNPGLRAGFHDGFENGRRDFDSRHTYVPERAFRRNGRPQYREEFGPRDDFYRAYHDGYIHGYDRGYHGGDPGDFDREHDRDHHDDHHGHDDH